VTPEAIAAVEAIVKENNYLYYFILFINNYNYLLYIIFIYFINIQDFHLTHPRK